MDGMNQTTKAGYTLDGWYTQSVVKWNENWGVTSEYCQKDKNGDPVRTEEPDKNYFYYTVKLTAVWDPDKITVKYDKGEHGSTDAPESTTSIGSTVVLPAAATPETGWLFTGWADSR